MTKLTKIIIGIFLILIILVTFFLIISARQATVTKYGSTETTRESRREIEKAARGMIANYTIAIDQYARYKNSESSAEQDIAEKAKMRANEIAIFYNRYIERHQLVWEEKGLPEDIYESLASIE